MVVAVVGINATMEYSLQLSLVHLGNLHQQLIRLVRSKWDAADVVDR